MKVIDDTRGDLEQLIANDFGISSSGNYEDHFINWLHFRARRVPRLPRRVLISQEAHRHCAQYPAIGKIYSALKAGSNVDPWLSRKTFRNIKNHLSDMMFNDWQIVHFHLGSIFESRTTINRTGPLLFVHITANEATILDVQPHGSWTMIALLEILLRTNPAALERYELRGITPTYLSDTQYKKIRSNGCNVAIEVSGRAFTVGGPIASSGHAMRLSLYHDQFFIMIDKIQEDFGSNQIEPHLKSAIYARLGIPIRLGAHYDERGMAIIDKNRKRLVLYRMRPLE